MRSTKPIRSQGAPRWLTGLLTRVLALGGCAGAIVVAWHLLAAPDEPETAPPTAAMAAAQLEERALPAQATPAASERGPRVVYPGPPVRSAPPLRGTEATSSGGAAGVRPVDVPAPSVSPPTPLPDSPPAPVVVPVTREAVSPAVPAESRAGDVQESVATDLTAVARRVDLNTASLAELNALPGAGLIGRAIIRGRPYTSPEDLLTKRVVNKATYQLIKDQVRAQ